MVVIVATLLYHQPVSYTHLLHNPVNTTIYFAVPHKIVSNSIDTIAWYSEKNNRTINVENIVPFAAIAVAAVGLFILLAPYETIKEINIFKYPAKIKLEPLVIGITLAFAGIIVVISVSYTHLSSASFSILGPIILHGPHHVAKKSTNTLSFLINSSNSCLFGYNTLLIFIRCV